MSEGEIFELAHRRPKGGRLWPALYKRGSDFPKTMEMLADLRKFAGVLRPYDLIERILIHHDGRRKLLARLGPEAEEGIDALLQQALGYERIEIPDLTGFLTWLETDDVDIKRQMDSAGDLIRVMTVHGAKGLEAPVVILPDTAKQKRVLRNEILLAEGAGALWRLSADKQPELQRTALANLKAAQDEEEERLFYVAATRAKTWLIVAAAGEVGEGVDSWHQKSETALRNLDASSIETPTGQGLRLGHLDWSSGSIAEEAPPKQEPVEIPDWALRPVVRDKTSGLPIPPTDLGGAKVLPGSSGRDKEEALKYGEAVHQLLDMLPGVAPENRAGCARRLLSADEGFPLFSEEDMTEALAEAEAVLDDPGISHIFVPNALSEVDFSAALPELNGARVAGAIDRLIIDGNRAFAIDFKTNAEIPADVSEVPEGLLRQMGAYQSALEQIYPDKSVETAIVWTKAPSLMPLPPENLRNALQRALKHIDAAG